MNVALTLFAIIIITFLISAELFFFFLIRHPNWVRKMPVGIQNGVGYLYIQGERKVMPFVKGCGRYSPEFGYTLKPGDFLFTEREFSNHYHINSLGVRGDEDDLSEPDLVVLGDSYSLGWGVEHEEMFSRVLARMTGMKVLNTAIPSFGTVREMMMLRKIDRSQLKGVILQYCGDDYEENVRYIQNGDLLPVMRKETFEQLMESHSQPKRYFFGKYVGMKIKKKVGELAENFRPQIQVDERPSEVDAFLHVLIRNQDLLVPYPLIIFEMNGIRQSNEFTKGLRQAVENKKASYPWMKNISILDTTSWLRDEHFYILDGHLNAEGNRVVAEMLYGELQRLGLV
ncbi:MAG TPA: hypothetical protein PLT64_06140 [Syntrophales bacterium]|nr:hypothetical protein [Syntrophales bacterium]HOL59434.1 hypothetical protein [Syntrophales bacterium]HPO35591.1 hypothetical protein [Syntrophales bacterium]